MNSNTDVFTKLPNSVLSWLYGPNSNLTGREMKMMLVIFRFTYGFHRDTAMLSSRFVSDATGIDPANINKVFKALERKGLITINLDRKTRVVSLCKKVYKNKQHSYADGVVLTPEDHTGQNDLNIGVVLTTKKESKQREPQGGGESLVGDGFASWLVEDQGSSLSEPNTEEVSTEEQAAISEASMQEYLSRSPEDIQRDLDSITMSALQIDWPKDSDSTHTTPLSRIQ